MIREKLKDGLCPDCGGFVWRPGPRGGMAQNVECAGCGSRFNVAYWNGPHNPWPQPATPIMAQRIPSERDGGEWREDMSQKVLQ